MVLDKLAEAMACRAGCQAEFFRIVCCLNNKPVTIYYSDLLVIGMHKRAGVSGGLGPSITDQVVRHAGCTVMVVKQYGYEYDFDAIE